ncbi:MAG: MvaI/BcnI family restriction endonuclease [Anaerolineaceae bacterium]
MKIYTKDSLITVLKEIRDRGWIPNARPGNAGGVGNTLEDLLGIEENNLPIPNAAEWELKAQRSTTSSLTTLLHMEPSPRALRIVPKILLPNYGWRHESAGITYPLTEMSFRQTISGLAHSDRGFIVKIDDFSRKVVVSFDYNKVGMKHKEWVEMVDEKIGLDELNPQPYWGFDDLYHKAGTKLLNTFYVQAEVLWQNGIEFFHYNRIYILRGFRIENLTQAILDGDIFVDFDARTHHNHGTKFRLRQNLLPKLYSDIQEII